VFVARHEKRPTRADDICDQVPAERKRPADLVVEFGEFGDRST
jgi:hypothetical protein